MDRFRMPGLGLAVVKDRRTVLALGYGGKSIETGEMTVRDLPVHRSGLPLTP